MRTPSVVRTPVWLLCVLLTMIGGCAPESSSSGSGGDRPGLAPPPQPALRVASYNVSLYTRERGGLAAQLEAGDERARRLAAVIQHLRPDLLLLNEFDFDAYGRAAEVFQRRYLEIGQDGLAPLRYDYRYAAPVNTGEPSGLDLDGDGRSEGPQDAFGFGFHPGQYGMLVLSRYPIDVTAVRSFRQLRWSAMPQARRPHHPDGRAYHDDAIWAQLRLSSKSHWDVPVDTPLGRIHFLVSHPTPPVFDGPENRNGLRNADEIRLWSEYLAGADWLCDDAGRCGGLAPDASFVLAGDLNSDPDDGDSLPEAIAALLADVRLRSDFVPRSDGAAAQAATYGLARRGDPAAHTGDFGPEIGTLRLDYVLPSRDFEVRDGGVFWPLSPAQHAHWAAASDHHLVWLDLARAP